MNVLVKSLAGLLPAFFLVAAAAPAQTAFVDATPAADPYFNNPEEEDFWMNALAPADVDLDGDLDLAAIGFHVVYNESVEDRLVIFVNQGPDTNGRWLFDHVLVPMGDLTAGASDLAWGDYDGDGDDDLAVGSNEATVLYRNDAGTLTAQQIQLPGYVEDSEYDGSYDLRSLAWADVDNDGDLDLLIPSIWDPEVGFVNALMLNGGSDGNGGWTFVDAGANIEPAGHAQTQWVDDDGDGDLDLMMLNIETFSGSDGFLKRFENQAGSFVASTLPDVVDLKGTVDWADADGDGDLDYLVAGNLQRDKESYTTVLRIHRNDGNGVYTQVVLEEVPSADWLDIHAATWADYDSDGDVDILATGSYVGDSEIVGHSKIYANNGTTWEPLALELPAPISSIGRGGTFTWLDLDGDGDLDYLVAGAHYMEDGNGLVESRMTLFLNDAAATNQAPGSPGAVQALLVGEGSVQWTWTAASDDHTAAGALTYDLEIVPASATSLPKRLPEPGGIGTEGTWTLSGLEPGTYRYRLCAVDSALNAGVPATGTFTVGAVALFADGFESGSTAGWTSHTP